MFDALRVHFGKVKNTKVSIQGLDSNYRIINQERDSQQTKLNIHT